MEILDIETIYTFYNQEVKHYLEKDRFRQDKITAFKTVSQAIYWCTLFFESAKKINKNRFDNYIDKHDLNGQVYGIIYARNRVTHQYPQLLKISNGAQFPIPLPSPFFEIIWKTLDELPDADKKFDNKKQKSNYTKHLANRPIRFTFDSLIILFDNVLKDEIFSKRR